MLLLWYIMLCHGTVMVWICMTWISCMQCMWRWYDDMQSDVMWRDMMQCHVMWCHVTSCNAMQWIWCKAIHDIHIYDVRLWYIYTRCVWTHAYIYIHTFNHLCMLREFQVYCIPAFRMVCISLDDWHLWCWAARGIHHQPRPWVHVDSHLCYKAWFCSTLLTWMESCAPGAIALISAGNIR